MKKLVAFPLVRLVAILVPFAAAGGRHCDPTSARRRLRARDHGTISGRDRVRSAPHRARYRAGNRPWGGIIYRCRARARSERSLPNHRGASHVEPVVCRVVRAVGAILEELLFRGVLFRLFAARRRFCRHEERVVSIGLHFAWNFCEGSIYGTLVSGGAAANSLFSAALTGPAWLTGGASGPEAGVPAIAAASLALLVYARRKGRCGQIYGRGPKVVQKRGSRVYRDRLPDTLASEYRAQTRARTPYSGAFQLFRSPREQVIRRSTEFWSGPLLVWTENSVVQSPSLSERLANRRG